MNFLTRRTIEVSKILEELRNPQAGAVVTFQGLVRNHNVGKAVRFLEYSAYEELAEKMIAEIIGRARTKFSIAEGYCVHRLGRAEIGECVVLVITLSAHRREAYRANQFIIDEVKHSVPIWKKEFFADGSTAWSNCPACSTAEELPVHRH